MAPISLHLSAKDPAAYGPLVLAHLANTAHANAVKITLAESATASCTLIGKTGLKFTKPTSVLRYLARALLPDLYEHHHGTRNNDRALAIDHVIDDLAPLADVTALRAFLAELNTFLTLRSFFVGYELSLADIAVWARLRASPIFVKQAKAGVAANEHPHVARWYALIDDSAAVTNALAFFKDQAALLNKAKKDQGSFEIDLPGAQMGQVVTRFPPEPSGYLHIGHTKAALMNEYFARKYKGKLIVRFDDTNPSKEKMEFEDSIKQDLAMIGVAPDVVTHTSDSFPLLLQYAEQLIRQGDAYVDDTDQETMRNERMHGIASKNRDNSIEENLRRWNEMKQGTEVGLKNCLRAKMSVDDKNKALRDPVLYRCNLTPHHKTGSTYKVYPTYDFACPVVDSVEGVTHALRTNEYRDRNPQYEWVLQKLNLRHVHIWDFSRMNFVYTLLSKRKLQWFVDQGHVPGWDDPRFPTVRGIRRRGMTIEALKQYILMQGASTNNLMLEWDKFWAVNKKVIDPIAPRHVAIDTADLVPVTLVDGPATAELKQVPKHKKNPDLGTKTTAFAKTIYVAGADANEFADNEEVTLMDWGNAIVTQVHRDATTGRVIKVVAKLNLAGDVKSTKKKLTWLANAPKATPLTSVLLKDYDYLITKKKLEEDDDFQSVLTPVTEFTTEAVGDANLCQLNVGDIIQLERRGYYICDANDGKTVTLISIPDGKAASLQSKHNAAAAAPATPKAAAPAAGAPAKKEAAAPVKKAAAAAPASPKKEATPAPVATARSQSRSRSRSRSPAKKLRSKSPSKKAAAKLDTPIMYPIANVYGDGFPVLAKEDMVLYPVQNPYHN
ncbi:glutamine-tRNA ligase [Allomyces macrogynus ATCC 38327]|uniref:Probable glutamate--tRNA ligase, cytoplasmic n=1 Tax=Allomyces macrogynus (strain ATCC 38327) TaxID=578462 RepID=A0A0L0RZD2_ALLM3|nr:glutamine-tRNA ligase [Allomyces macrogynus ATCC 38327]|eukprot:KNE55446.1 glutamine-tRNA ligase [Allomyces macrogynus ATCC 38327]